MDENEQKLIPAENVEEKVESIQDAADPTNDESIPAEQESIDPEAIEELKSTQSFAGAIAGGLLGAVAGAAAWAIVTALTKYQIGFMALAIGFITGFLVRKLGRGFEKHFGYIGAAFSLIGCFLGNILAVLIMISYQEAIPFFDLLSLLDISILVDIIVSTFSAMDLLFYGIAIYEGYKFSFISRDDINVKLNSIMNSRNIQA